LVLARSLREQVELQGATGCDHGKEWVSWSWSTSDRLGFERFPLASLLQQQSGLRRVRIDGLKNGLKSPGCRRISMDVTGMKKGAKAPVFNDLQTSMEVCRS
ncbi:hypothetical protein, partial [Acidovorax sp. SUPP3334]|uniref:hypothetical protein n=1 Tax=Acidovorax sp. SUPP3334 TaxID=2920881 RepID=UPI0024E0A095